MTRPPDSFLLPLKLRGASSPTPISFLLIGFDSAVDSGRGEAAEGTGAHLSQSDGEAGQRTLFLCARLGRREGWVQ